MNKKGNIVGIIYLLLIMFVLLIGGLFLAFGSLTLNWVFDEAVPSFTGLGMVGNTNATQISQFTLTPVNNLVQSFTWMTGVLYIFGILGCFGFAFSFRFTGNRWLMGFFISCMLLLIIASIFISNIYQDFYMDTGDVGSRLKEHAMLSFLILNSPIIMSVIGFVCGIIMFTGGEEETQVV